MSQERCFKCGKGFVEAMVDTDQETLERAAGDSVVAGMVSFVEGMQEGYGALEECPSCGKTICRTCARTAGMGLEDAKYACPACSNAMDVLGLEGLDISLTPIRSLGAGDYRAAYETIREIKEQGSQASPIVVRALMVAIEGPLKFSGSESIQKHAAIALGLIGPAASEASGVLQEVIRTDYLEAYHWNMSDQERKRVETRAPDVKFWARFALERVHGNSDGAVKLLAKDLKPSYRAVAATSVLKRLGQEAEPVAPQLIKFLEGYPKQRKSLEKWGEHENRFILEKMLELAEESLVELACHSEDVFSLLERRAKRESKRKRSGIFTEMYSKVLEVRGSD